MSWVVSNKMPSDMPHKIMFVTILPAPYQRDLFAALAARADVDLTVCYLDTGSPHNPWPRVRLRPYERLLPGFSVPLGRVAMYVNWRLPVLSPSHAVVLSTFISSLTGQWMMRSWARRQRWVYWGECFQRRSGLAGHLQRALAAPLARASGLVGIGSDATEEFGRWFPSIPRFCIPYHCDLSGFFRIRRDPTSTNSLTFLFCGQMIYRKGIDVLLSAFDRLVRRGLDARLLLIGREAELPAYLETISPAARARILYEGFQAPEALPGFFGHGDVFVLPSRYDGWGVVINQALAAGLPIIASNAVGAARDLVATGVNGVLIPPGDVDRLERAMESLISDRDFLMPWGLNSRRKARALTPERGAEKWVQVFKLIRESDHFGSK
jgi:glycosyltransferase involved in cell wall biosynthesis